MLMLNNFEQKQFLEKDIENIFNYLEILDKQYRDEPFHERFYIFHRILNNYQFLFEKLLRYEIFFSNGFADFLNQHWTRLDGLKNLTEFLQNDKELTCTNNLSEIFICAYDSPIERNHKFAKIFFKLGAYFTITENSAERLYKTCMKNFKNAQERTGLKALIGFLLVFFDFHESFFKNLHFYIPKKVEVEEGGIVKDE